MQPAITPPFNRRKHKKVDGGCQQGTTGSLVTRGRALKFLAATVVALSGAMCVPASLFTVSGQTHKLRSLVAVHTKSGSIVGGSAYLVEPSTIVPYSNGSAPNVGGSSSNDGAALLSVESRVGGRIRVVEDRTEQNLAGKAPQPSGNDIEDAGAGGESFEPHQQVDEPSSQPCGEHVLEEPVLGQAGECPRCDSMFEKLGRTKHGNNVQDVSMQVWSEARKSWLAS